MTSQFFQVAEHTKYLVHASYLEIYNEDVRDLLSKNVKDRLEVRGRNGAGHGGVGAVIKFVSFFINFIFLFLSIFFVSAELFNFFPVHSTGLDGLAQGVWVEVLRDTPKRKRPGLFGTWGVNAPSVDAGP